MSAKDLPILFKEPMVRAILAGDKTMTRRIVKLPTGEVAWHFIECSRSAKNCNDFVATFSDAAGNIIYIKCPYGAPGDRLWVRETWAVQHEYDSAAPSEIGPSARWHYAATEDLGGLRRRPSIFLPRRGSRILLGIVDVRVERLQDISEEDARAEGISDGGCLTCGNSEPCGCANPQPDARDAFSRLWQSIHGSPNGWYSNPLVWVVSFQRMQP